jgi:hypothetical protein
MCFGSTMIEVLPEATAADSLEDKMDLLLMASIAVTACEEDACIVLLLLMEAICCIEDEDVASPVRTTISPLPSVKQPWTAGAVLGRCLHL